MQTNHLMLKELFGKYHPRQRGWVSKNEYKLIKETLCMEEMDILQLRNLRDFTVASFGRSEDLTDWDRMSAVVYVIDSEISKLGGEV